MFQHMNYSDTLRQRLRVDRILPHAAYQLGRAAAPVLARRSPLRGQSFLAWEGEPQYYFAHAYNSTFRNERAVEIPLALDFLWRHQGGRGLEFGNVLAHYGYNGWPVVDKYERRPGTINSDIMDYRPTKPFDFIIAISTLEHVGWDERPQRPDKALAAYEHLRSLLAPNGKMFLTVPLGHHPGLDSAILEYKVPVTRQMTLVRDAGRWRRTEVNEFRPYRGSGHGADSVWVAEAAALMNDPSTASKG